MNLTVEANAIWSWVRAEYIKARYPPHTDWAFRCDDSDRAVFAELRAHGLIAMYNADPDEFVLTERGLDALLCTNRASDAQSSTPQIYSITINNSNIGAVASGTGSVSHGTVTRSCPEPVSATVVAPMELSPPTGAIPELKRRTEDGSIERSALALGASESAEGPAPVAAPTRIFISYTHDSPAHCDSVLRLAQQLRRDGLDCQLDQFVHGGPPEGWPRWMLRQVEQAEFVIVICTETYKRRFEGNEKPGSGKGADWEGVLVLQQLYDTRSLNDRILPVLLDGADDKHIPLPLRPFTHYRLPSEYQDLYRHLTNQPRVVPIPCGPIKVVPPDPQ